MRIEDYDHVKCNCNGIIGLFDRRREIYTCERCGRKYLLTDLDYDNFMVNDKTGWIFPMKKCTDDKKGE